MDDKSKVNVMEPWRTREQLPALNKLDIVLALAAIFVCALGVALYAYEQIAFFILLLLFAYTAMTMRSLGATSVILLTAVAASVMLFSLSGAAFVLSLVVGTGTLAWLTTTQKYPYLIPICLVLAFVLAGLITESLTDALLTLSFVPSGLLLALATVTHQRRTTAICYAVGGFLITLFVLLAVFLMKTCGTLEIGVIKEYIAGLQKGLGDGMVYVRDEFLKYMETTLAAEAYNAEEISEMITQLRDSVNVSILTSVAATVFSILPAVAVMICSILGFEAQMLLNATYFRTGWKRVLTPQSVMFTMSLPAAIIYSVSFFVTLFFGGGSLIGAAMQNLCLILLPGFCVMGWGALLGTLKRSRGGAKILWLIFFALLICFSGAMSLFLLALWGSNAVIMAALHLYLLRRMSDGGHDADQDDNDHNDPE